jgi:hypothetical protein
MIKKLINYIGILFLLIFIPTNNTFGFNPMINEAILLESLQAPEIVQEELEKTDMQRYILVLNSINKCQASVMSMAKYINITTAIIVNVSPANITLIKQLNNISIILQEKYKTLNDQEMFTQRKLAELGAKPENIQPIALAHFNNIMTMSQNAYKGSHVPGQEELLSGWVLALLETTKVCQNKIKENLTE